MSSGDIAKGRVTARKTISHKLILQLLKYSIDALRSTRGEVLLSCTKEWDERTTEIYLVAILGVRGLEVLHHAITLFSTASGNLRKSLLMKFVNQINPGLTEEQCMTLEQLVQRNCPLLNSHALNQDAYVNILKELREVENNCAYAQILVPPVSSCLKKNLGSSLKLTM